MTALLMSFFVVVFPRLFSLMIWLLTDWWGAAFPGWFWPLVGVIFMPATTLTILGANLNAGGLQRWWIVLLVLAVAYDYHQLESERKRRSYTKTEIYLKLGE